MASLAACPRLAARAALARPLVRCSSSLTAPNWAPWPQRQQAQRDVAAAARNRLADLLADMREEEKVEETASSVPEVTKLEWQAPLGVLRYPDPRLRAPNAHVAVFDDSLRQLAAEMFEVMYQDDGVGLAAPQVGVNVRLMVFNEAGERGKGDEIVLVNPQIVSTSRSDSLFEEGCLSFPNIYADVRRPRSVKVKAQDMTGRKFTVSLSGFPARIFQHEYDHLDARLFHDRMEPEVLAGVRDELVALEEEYLKAHPGADVQRVA